MIDTAAVASWLHAYWIVPTFVVFLLLVAWAYLPSHRARFDRDSRIIFEDDR